MQIAALDTTMEFASVENGVIATRKGLYYTRDGEISWRASRGAGEAIGVDFANPADGWAVTIEPRFEGLVFGPLLHTTDGGASWRPLPAPPTGAIVVPDFVSSLDGYGLTRDGHLFRTVDGVRTWRTVETPAPVSDECFTTPTMGWIASGGQIYRLRGSSLELSLSRSAIDSGAWHNTPTPTLSCCGSGVVADYVFAVAMSQTPMAVARFANGRWKVVADSVEPSPVASFVDGRITSAFGMTTAGSEWWLGECTGCQDEPVSITTTDDAGATFQLHVVEVATSRVMGLFADAASFLDPMHGWIAITDSRGGTHLQSETRLLFNLRRRHRMESGGNQVAAAAPRVRTATGLRAAWVRTSCSDSPRQGHRPLPWRHAAAMARWPGRECVRG